MPYDKKKKLHFLCSLLISLLISLHNPIYGLSTGVIAGVSKEVYDYYAMYYTWAGAVIGTCLCLIMVI